MPRFRARSTWIVSSFSRQRAHSAIAHNARAIVPLTTLSPPVVHLFPRLLSSSITSTIRKPHLTHGSESSEKDLQPSRSGDEYTVAQIARAASQAVRVSILEGNVRDAHYVVYSILQYPRESGINLSISSRRLLNPIKFGIPVPSRLVVHSLVHGLIREGLTMAAGREIEKMMPMGIRFRARTVEASVVRLCSAISETLEDGMPVDKQDGHFRLRGLSEDSKTSRILEQESRNIRVETRLAIDILSTARQSRHQRSGRMYGWLVDACLLQGEIVVATLLFVLLVKDWQLRKVLKPLPTDDAGNAADTFQKDVSKALLRLDLPSQSLAQRLGLDDSSHAIPYPEKSILQNILNSINRNIFSSSTTEKCRSDSLTSLAIIADLVDQRRLPFGQLSSVIRTLYSCPPSGQRHVRYITGNGYAKVNVYKHARGVLLRLCQSLPSENSRPSLVQPEVLPRLDTRTYNALIHYALRHRLSPFLADAVIQHMTLHRRPPLQPDVVTYNTLLRETSLLRRNDLTSKVLHALRHRKEDVTDAITAVASLEDMHPSNTSQNASVSLSDAGGYALVCQRIASEDMSIPDIPNPSLGSHYYARPRTVRADNYTLSSYITHIVSTGRPHIIVNLIFHLLPELHVIDHPAYDSPSAWKTSRENWLLSRRECIQRAVTYGPVVFCALLNALRKAGKTGLAERVWLLARQAERASWTPSDRPDTPAPWCLPIQAYTCMLQCYASESKKGVALVRGSRFSQPLNSALWASQERKEWVPQSNLYVKGWAYFYLKMQAKERGYRDTQPPPRWKMSRAVGHLLLKTMRQGAISVWQDLMSLQQEYIVRRSPLWAARLQSLEFPVGDARFFNAALDLFGRLPNMQARRIRVSPSWWQRKLRITQQRYRDSGWLSMAYDHTLVEIARGMAQSGHEIPLGLQRVLVGRVNFRLEGGKPRNEAAGRLPFPKSWQACFRPFSIPVTKTRGLPLKRRGTTLRRKRRRWKDV